jgi:hypothetical protein
MTLQQTVTIPADRRLVLKVPREVPIGAVEITFSFKDAADLQPETFAPIHVCHTLDEARTDAARKSTPVAREEFRRIMRETHGALEHSKTWGQKVDVVAEIRKMRDEWGDPWAEADERDSRKEQDAPHD